MYSLSRTLTVRFSLTMFVALLLIALWAYVGTRRVLLEQLDRGITAAYQIERAALASGGRLPRHEDSPDVRSFTATVNRFVALRDSNGAIIQINTRAAAELPLDRDGYARARAGELVWRTQPWPHGVVRTLLAPGAEAGSVLQVSADRSPLEDVTRTVLFLMLGTVLLGTSATAIGAGWLARGSVRPVQEIADQAQQVRPGETGHRITVYADAEEFDSLVRVLNSMLEQLDRGLDAERRIIANVGHDLRTPITAMRGEIEVALRGARSADAYRQVLASVLEEVGQLESIADALLLLARIEARELQPELIPVDLAAVAQQALERRRMRGEGLRITLLANGDTTALADAGMVRVVLDQLLDNAQKYAAGTETRITVERADAHVTLAVEDEGPGVPAEALAHLFERFYRGDPARSRGGAGLGLTIAKAIAEAHGGRITAERSGAGGLRVVIALPGAR